MQEHILRLLPAPGSTPSLSFAPLEHTLQEGGPPITLKRLCDRPPSEPAALLDPSSNTITFNTKVISRNHAEIWAEIGGRLLVKAHKTTSPTFLNGSRLSPSEEESAPFELRDGDLLQLGNNYEGGVEDMYKCVRIKIGVDDV